MSETITKQKKKKKIDFSVLRKLEDEYDEAKEDADRKEEVLVKKVHSDYLNAENKTEFFKELHKSERWYRNKFEEYNLPLQFAAKSAASSESHAERKKQQILNQLDNMEKEIEKTHVVEVDPLVAEEAGYVDPREQEKDWIHRTKIEIQEEEPKKITEDSNFGKYQDTKSRLEKARSIYKSDFNVSEKYKKILIHELKKTKEHIDDLLGEIEKND